MSPRLRFALVSIGSACVALLIGFQIAEESYALAGLLAVGAVWIALEWRARALPEAWLVASLLAGYLIGNRGFAQLSLLPNFPLLPAEAGLVIIVSSFVVRMAMKQLSAVRRDALNYAIAIWALLAAARLPLDLRSSGMLAVRDFAMVYYAAFFFIGQGLAAHPASRRLLLRTLTVAFALLPVVLLVYQLAPDFFLTHLVWRGTPLLFHKSDLSAAFLGAGFFWLWSRWEKKRNKLWLLPASVSLVLIATMASPRAAMVAVGVLSLCWLASGRARLVVAQLGLAAATGLVLLFVSSLTNRDFRASALYSVYEHTLSIFDIYGQREYLHTSSGDPVDNNRFRLIWWESVADETLRTNPAFGLGFGHDLAAQFIATYEKVGAEDFSARSPHSIVVSTLGRMGLAGLAFWIVIAACMAQLAWRIFRRADPDQLGLVSVAGVVWISACFGVVLEGPMGAVIFWTILGLANAIQGEKAPAASESSHAAGEPDALQELPAAAPVPEMTHLT